MKYPITWKDDNEIKRLFTWQTRVGLAPKFGSRPISWYQMHQTNVYDIIVELLDATEADPKEVFMRHGIIVTKDGVSIGTVNDIFRRADR